MIVGIAVGLACGLGSIMVALCAIILISKWKKGIRSKENKRSILQEKSRSTLGATDLE
jgi:uncharacterized membrane protein YhiD involved in acid resistance